MRAARFQSDEKRCAARFVSAAVGIAQRFDLRVRFAGAMMPAAADDFSVSDQHRANHGIGRSLAETAFCQAQSLAHEDRIIHRQSSPRGRLRRRSRFRNGRLTAAMRQSNFGESLGKRAMANRSNTRFGTRSATHQFRPTAALKKPASLSTAATHRTAFGQKRIVEVNRCRFNSTKKCPAGINSGTTLHE